MKPLLDQTDVAKMFGVSPRTPEKWRCDKTGPTYVSVGGRRKYREEDLIAWLNLGGKAQTKPIDLTTPKRGPGRPRKTSTEASVAEARYCSSCGAKLPEAK